MLTTWFRLAWETSFGASFTTDYWLPAGLEEPSAWRERRAYILHCIAFGKRSGLHYVGMRTIE